MKTLSERIQFILKENVQLEGTEGHKGLAKAAKASKSVVNQWLDGKIKSMRLDYALNIERELGYDHVWLVLGDGEPRPRKISPLAKVVATAFDQISDPDQRSAILTQLKAFGVLHTVPPPEPPPRAITVNSSQKESSGSF